MNAPIKPEHLNTREIQSLDSAHFLHPFTDHGDLSTRGSRVITRADGVYGGTDYGNLVANVTKDSGYGRFDGRAVIDEFTELKWLTIEPSVQQYPF